MFMTYWSIDPLLISEQLLRVSLKARQNMIPLEISYSEKVLHYKLCHALISLDVNILSLLQILVLEDCSLLNLPLVFISSCPTR